jgi:hydroxymethylpyrimidine pyrophosphatase-like HAD family hydrolase
MLILCDIDGTAANINHRRHFVEDKKHSHWGKFFDAMVDDTPNEWCQKLLHALVVDGHKVVFISGRPDSHRIQTERWLGEHYTKVFNGELYMRPAGNYDPDYRIKENILAAHFDDHDEILFVIDDRKQVVDMWRSKGLTVLQCDEGNF